MGRVRNRYSHYACAGPRLTITFSALGEEIVSIIVGGLKRKTFCVHKNLLRDGGDCFDVNQSGPNKRFKKVKTNTKGQKIRTLVNFGPQSMAYFINWLYCKELPKKLKTREDRDTLFELYYLAEMQDDKGLLNTTMDKIQDVSRLHKGYMTVEYLKTVRNRCQSRDSGLYKFSVFPFAYEYYQHFKKFQGRMRIKEAREATQDQMENSGNDAMVVRSSDASAPMGVQLVNAELANHEGQKAIKNGGAKGEMNGNSDSEIHEGGENSSGAEVENSNNMVKEKDNTSPLADSQTQPTAKKMTTRSKVNIQQRPKDSAERLWFLICKSYF